VVIATTVLAIDHDRISKELFRALVMLMALFSTALAPDLPVRSQVIIDCDLILLVLVRLLNDALDHGDTFGQVIITASGNQHVQRLVFVNLISIVNFAFTLRASTSDLNLATALFFKLLLRLALGTDDLTYVVYRRVIRVGDIDSLVLLWRLVVWWGLKMKDGQDQE
jgi:hypothetical protein